MKAKRREQLAILMTIAVALAVIFLCVFFSRWFADLIKAENACRDIISNFDYHVINNRVYCIDPNTIKLIDSGVTIGWTQ